MFFKMVNLNIHPHELMGNFCRDYEQKFKEIIETGDYDIEIKTDIQNYQFKATPTTLLEGNKNAGALFYKILTYLEFLIKNPNDTQRKRIINTEVGKLNIMLQGDEFFDKTKK